MFRIVEGNNLNLPDVGEFVALINRAEFFGADAEVFAARAPGRLDVMGGIADYSGSLMLEMPIREATFAAVQKRSDRLIKIRSISGSDELAFEMPLGEFETPSGFCSYEAARLSFENRPDDHWAAYAAGIFLVLMRERGARFANGANVLISSNVPLGKGVSSSAALEVAVMTATAAAFDIGIEPKETAILCQMTENLVVGAPCGVMDQMSSVCGEENRLMALVCRPAELQPTVDIPNDIAFWGIDSGVRHAVVGADYGSVRVGAFMGYRIIADLAGLTASPNPDGTVSIDDDRWHGYLTSVTPKEFAINFVDKLPESVTGAEFKKLYHGTTDRVTKIDPAKSYPVRAASAHAVYENARVHRFRELLGDAVDEAKFDALGELMFQAHASYAACGLTEDGTDRLVEMVRERRSKGLFGAKITGGGSGGTVAIMGLRDSFDEVCMIASAYADETGRAPYVFRGSSPGAARFGHLRLRAF